MGNEDTPVRELGEEKTPPEDELNVEFISNEVLDKLHFVLAVSKLESEILIEQISRLGGYIGKRGRRHLNGAIAEAHVDLVTAKFALQNAGVQLDPIPENASTNNFKFLRGPKGNLRATEKGSARGKPIDVADYDQVIVLNGLPVVIEVKSTRHSLHQESRKKAESVNKRFAPLIEYFGTNKFGYVIVSPTHGDTERLIEPFNEKSKGILMPHLSFSTHELKQAAVILESRLTQENSSQESGGKIKI